METFKNWVGKNPITFGGIVALLLAAFGICLIIGALKNWDWLYEPDKHYRCFLYNRRNLLLLYSFYL